MRKADTNKQKLVYGLDIGTRSVVGTVGYLEKDRFVVVALRSKEHETRAMIDGQIHDIGAVSETISEVTEALEADIGQPLHQVCIAAAGRVLRTVTTHVDIDFEGDKIITKEDIFALDSYGVEKAYEEFQQTNDLDMKFYCVGYTVMRYYMNDYPMGNLENHKARTIAADLIATFLPDDVVDGLYKAVQLAGLEVANLTLEPIAAMEVAIPQMYRMLNIALIDVGAGTSDISVTKDGSIVAYGMLPIAGDCMTEDIARHCLVDFTTAEAIKRGIETQEEVEYKDIMGLPQTITREQVLAVVAEHLDSMAKQAADKIMELNGDKPVSAVFVVGGGGKIAGYTDIVAKSLGIVKERCAVRGEEVMQKIEILPNDVQKDSMLVTPIGICLNFYEQSNNFMFVTFNGQRIKLYDNNKLAIVDAAIQAEFSNEELFPKRGKALTFTFNGKQKMIRGERGESAQILLNGNPADIHTPIRANDVISVTSSSAGADARMELGKLPEYRDSIRISVNGKQMVVPKFAAVNGKLESPYYEIQEGDEVEMLGYYTVEQVTQVMDVLLEKEMEILVNHAPADMQTKVYDNFSVEWTLAAPKSSEPEEEPAAQETQAAMQETEVQRETAQTDNMATGRLTDTEKLLEKAKASAQRIADAPLTQEVEEEFKKARAYEAAQRISAFATAYNQTGQMPPVPTQKLPGRPAAMPQMKESMADKEPRQPMQAATRGGREEASQADMERPQDSLQEQPETSVVRAQEKIAAADTSGTDSIGAKKAGTDGQTVIVTVNGEKVVLSGKPDYIYVDVFDHIDFDLTRPQGKTVETLINGRSAQYVEPLKTGDVLEIFWKE